MTSHAGALDYWQHIAAKGFCSAAAIGGVSRAGGTLFAGNHQEGKNKQTKHCVLHYFNLFCDNYIKNETIQLKVSV